MRVPVSMVVRMKSASNMIAKWYQSPSAVRLRSAPASMWAIPTAKVGAPPVRPIMVFSPTLAARSAICAGVTG